MNANTTIDKNTTIDTNTINSSSLYHLSHDYMKSINDALMSDELSIDQVDLLNQIEGDIEDKAIKIAAAIKNMEAEAENVRLAIKDMKARADRLDNKVDSLSRYLKFNLEACGIKEVRKSPHFVIKIKKCPASVVIDKSMEIPEEFLRTKITKEPDKILIGEKLKNGVELSFAKLEQNTKIEIK